MNRNRRDLLFYISLIVILIGQALLISMMVANKSTADQIVGYITGGFIPAVTLLFAYIQKRSLRLFLFSQRIRSVFSGRTPAWKLSAQFAGENITHQTFEQVISKLLATPPGVNSVSIVRVNEDVRHVVMTPGPTVELSFHRARQSPASGFEEQLPSYIQLLIRNYEVDYIKAAFAIEHKIIPTLEAITSVIQNVDAKYSMVIEYDKNSNPFFGLYVAHIDPALVSSFSVRLIINDYEPTDIIDISETKLAIHTRSQNALQGLALEFLTFDLRLGDKLQNGP